MSKIYNIKYKFAMSNIDSDVQQESLNYWTEQNFDCHLVDNTIIGKRGSSRGNLFSNNMTKLICDLKVKFDENEITVDFSVNGKFQLITEVNLASFKIEQLLFPYYLNKKTSPLFLNDFIKFRDKSALIWIFSFMILGRKMSDDLKIKIDSLANENDLPTIEIA